MLELGTILKLIEITAIVIGVIFLASWSIFINIKRNRYSNTMQLFHSFRKDEDFQLGQSIIDVIKDVDKKVTAEKLLEAYFSKKIKDKELKRLSIQFKKYLNCLEEIALGIHCGMYDEKICKRFLFTDVIRTWKWASKFVNDSQDHKNKTTLQEFKKLALKWNEPNNNLKAYFK